MNSDKAEGQASINSEIQKFLLQEEHSWNSTKLF